MSKRIGLSWPTLLICAGTLLSACTAWPGNASNAGENTAQPGKLGFGYEPITSEDLKDAGLDNIRGVFVVVVEQGGPAAVAGLKKEDLIVGFNGKPTDPNILRVQTSQVKAGDWVTLKILRPDWKGHVQNLSLRIHAAAKPNQNAGRIPSSTQVTWTTFRDPAEGAFTVKVPVGWNVRGQLIRLSSVEVKPSVEAISPDGSMVLFYGDPSLPIFSLPNAATAMAGLSEGMSLPYPQTPDLIISRYQSGDQFASNWGVSRLGGYCQGVQLKAARPRPEASQAINMAYAAGGVLYQATVGEAVFSCTASGQPAGGYIIAATELAQQAGTGIWGLKAGAGMVATAPRFAQASILLSQMAESFAYDDTWLSRQQETTANTSRINTQTNAAISRTIHDTYVSSQSKYEHIEDFARAIRGVELYETPNEGRRELPNAEYQWQLPNGGGFVGTSTSTPPVPGAQLVPRVKP